MTKDGLFRQVEAAAAEAMGGVGGGNAGLVEGGLHHLDSEEAELVAFGEAVHLSLIGKIKPCHN